MRSPPNKAYLDSSFKLILCTESSFLSFGFLPDVQVRGFDCSRISGLTCGALGSGP